MTLFYASDIPLNLYIGDSTDSFELPAGSCQHWIDITKPVRSNNVSDLALKLADNLNQGRIGYRFVETGVTELLRPDLDLPGILFAYRKRWSDLFLEKDKCLFVARHSQEATDLLDHCEAVIKIVSRALMLNRSIIMEFNELKV